MVKNYRHTLGVHETCVHETFGTVRSMFTTYKTFSKIIFDQGKYGKSKYSDFSGIQWHFISPIVLGKSHKLSLLQVLYHNKMWCNFEIMSTRLEIKDEQYISLI